MEKNHHYDLFIGLSHVVSKAQMTFLYFRYMNTQPAAQQTKDMSSTNTIPQALK